jgi:hypothetical protein
VAKGEATLLLKIKSLGEEVLDRLVITFDDLKNMIMSIPEALGKAIDAYREQERAVNELNQSMINAGTFTAELQNKYLELAGALQKTTLFSDDQINSAQALLQAHIGNKEVTEGLLRATLDLAQAKKMDLASAASLVGKAIGGESEVLKRYGIVVKSSTNDSDKLTNVTDALNQKFAGQAEAARKGTGGIDGLKTATGELAEAIGSQLAPKVAKLAESLIPIVDWFAKWADSGNLAKKSVNELSNELGEMQLKILELLGKRGNQFVDQAAVEAEIDYLTKQMVVIEELKAKQLADEKLAKENAKIEEDNRRAADSIKQQDKILKDGEFELQQKQLFADSYQAMLEGNGLKVEEIELKFLQNRYKNETDFHKKKALLKQIGDQQEIVAETKKSEILKRDREDFYSKMISLQGSSNSVLSAAGKAFAIRQIAIDTPIAITKALAAFPPPFNFAAAGLVGAAAAEQAARVAGIPMAEGGIVKARPGGIQATIGEGGRDEAVIPLENGQIPGSQGGNNITIIVNGGLLGDERTAQEFAGAVDKELLKLRLNGGSVAFEGLT